MNIYFISVSSFIDPNQIFVKIPRSFKMFVRKKVFRLGAGTAGKEGVKSTKRSIDNCSTSRHADMRGLWPRSPTFHILYTVQTVADTK